MMTILDLNNLSIEQIQFLEQITDEIMEDYHDLIARIHERAGTGIYWQVNNLLSRNNYISRVFEDVCCLELVRRVGAGDNITTIIVKTPSQKKVLTRYFKGQNKQIQFHNSLKSWLKTLVKPGYDFLRNIHWSLVYLMQKDNCRKKKIPRERPLTLIDTFFGSYIFKTGAFKERYYNGLLDHLTLEERKYIFFVPNVITWRNLKKIIRLSEKTRENFLYPFDFLEIRDYLYALAAPFFIKRIQLGDFVFRGMDIGPVLKADFRNKIALRSSFRGILFFQFFRRLKLEKIHLHLVIDWFENQVVDRGFNKGKNEFFPDTPSIGYQGLIAPYKWNFHVQPTEVEARAGVLPRQVAVIGSGLVDIAKKYYPGLDVTVAPGLRFSDIHKTRIKKTAQFNTKNPVILVALPIWVRDSLDILKILLEIQDVFALNKAVLLIKPHPSLDFKSVQSGLPLWPAMFAKTEGDFSRIITKADLLISTGSTVCMESIAYGIPVIVIGSRNGITKNIIPETVPKDIWALCHTGDEVSKALQRLCFGLSQGDRNKFSYQAQLIRESFFEPVSRAGVKQFLRMEQG